MAKTSGVFELSIQLGNAEMLSGADIAEALQKVADRLAHSTEDARELFADRPAGRIFDANGNTVGWYGVKS